MTVLVSTEEAARRRYAADELFDVCALLRATYGSVLQEHDGGEFTEDLQRLLLRAVRELDAIALKLIDK